MEDVKDGGRKKEVKDGRSRWEDGKCGVCEEGWKFAKMDGMEDGSWRSVEFAKDGSLRRWKLAKMDGMEDGREVCEDAKMDRMEWNGRRRWKRWMMDDG